jgi:hypothetical protein
MHSIGNHDVVVLLKERFAALTVGLLEPLGPGGPAHIAGMNPSRALLVRYLNPDGRTYSAPVQVTGRHLLSPGGVWIDPTPEKAGTGGANVRRNALESRPPGGDARSWPIKIPESEK